MLVINMLHLGLGWWFLFFKKGVCSNCNGITLLSLPGKVYSRVLKMVEVLADCQEQQCGFDPGCGKSTCSLPSHARWDPFGNLPFQSTYVLLDAEKSYDRARFCGEHCIIQGSWSMLQAHPSGRRPCGRPKTCWRDSMSHLALDRLQMNEWMNICEPLPYCL